MEHIPRLNSRCADHDGRRIGRQFSGWIGIGRRLGCDMLTNARTNIVSGAAQMVDRIADGIAIRFDSVLECCTGRFGGGAQCKVIGIDGGCSGVGRIFELRRYTRLFGLNDEHGQQQCNVEIHDDERQRIGTNY